MVPTVKPRVASGEYILSSMTAVVSPPPPETGLSDRAMVVRVANGDLEALGSLFERHEPSVRRYLDRLRVPAADVDDLIQATFLGAVRAAGSFDPQYSPRSWLLGIATMMVRRHRRSLQRVAARLARTARLAVAEPPRTPSELVEDRASAARVALAVDRLSFRKREVLVLVTLEGLSGEETARLLGIPVNTVWTRLHHARRELRAALEEGET
jgi:RNA polymerase sigma-70 factor (ECF subfamily)